MLLPLTLPPKMHSVIFVAGFWTSFGFCFGLCLDLIAMDAHPPSTSAAASTASSSSSASSPALDSAARRSCTKWSRRMSSYAHDKHSLCVPCRDVLRSVDTRCREYSSWSTDEMLEYLKHRKSLVSKGKNRSSVATPTYASPSVSPSVTPVKVSVSASKVASPVSTLPSLASEEGLKTFVHSVLASFLSQPSSSLGTNPFLPAPSAEVLDMSCSGSAGGSEGDNLMRGRLAAPSGVVPPPIQDNVISPLPPPSPNVSVHVSVASGTVGSGGRVGVLGPSIPSLGQFSDPYQQDLVQPRVRGAPSFDILHDAYSRDLRNVTPSPSPSFNPMSLLFRLSDSGFASLPSSVPFSSSPAFYLPLSSSSSASSFSSLAPSAPLHLFTLSSVVPSVISLSSSSSVPSFPLPQFSSPVYPSAAPPPPPIRLLLFLRFLLLLSLRLLFALLWDSLLLPLFLRLRSILSLFLRLLRSPLSPPLLLSLPGVLLRGILRPLLWLPLLCLLLLLFVLWLGILRIFRLGCWAFLRNTRH